MSPKLLSLMAAAIVTAIAATGLAATQAGGASPAASTVRLKPVVIQGTFWLYFPEQWDPKSPWHDQRVREAARLAIDYKSINEALTLGYARTVVQPTVDKAGSLSSDLAPILVSARYRLNGALGGRWGVQWNLALSAGNAEGRYLTLPERPALGSTGRRSGLTDVTLVDEWLELQARLSWSAGAELAWGPVETVSVSEAGFERIYQGLALLLTWPISGTTAELTTTLEVQAR